MDFLVAIEKFANENDIVLKRIEIDNFIAYQLFNDKLIELLSFIKNSEKLRFTILTDLFAADFPKRQNRFEVVYHFLSLKLNRRLFFKVELKEREKIQSISGLYKASCWYEREVYDMFGVVFEGCPDARRILTDYGFVGHPLRKDFPVTGHVQAKYDKSLEKVIYEPVLLEQEFRNFDFASPWEEPEGYILPGDEKVTK